MSNCKKCDFVVIQSEKISHDNGFGTKIEHYLVCSITQTRIWNELENCSTFVRGKST